MLNKRFTHSKVIYERVIDRKSVVFCSMDPNIYTVKAVLILDNDGERLLAKYYDDECKSVLNTTGEF